MNNYRNTVIHYTFAIKADYMKMNVALNFSPLFIHTQTVKGMMIIYNKTPIDYDQKQENNNRIEGNNRGINNQGWQEESYIKPDAWICIVQLSVFQFLQKNNVVKLLQKAKKL